MDKVKTPSYQEGLNELRENLSNMLPKEALDVFDQDARELEHNHTSPLKLREGDTAPNFSLSNAVNETVNLYDVLKESRAVLTFYRGTWCPYCNLALAQYQSILGEIKKAGATLIAISPQIPDESLSIKEKNNLEFEVLSDNGNVVSGQFVKVFKNGEKPLETMAQLGFDFDSFYADDSRELPVPATFIIEKDGTISFAKSEGGDYRNRVEPAEIMDALKK
ncbi:peroxiredoxin-like family protein [Flagellimonas sp.]|uniref:peroxiredoxin-like family protein n=1 Tax=Flagellimonas sp. TaxID=2058762 RepID=UPI003F49C27C